MNINSTLESKTEQSSGMDTIPYVSNIHLNLKSVWFDLILSGEKKEEYRDLTDYWKKRIDKLCTPELIFKKTITFSNGYAKNRRQFVIEWNLTHIGSGRVEWGAIPNKDYYVLELGDIISSNCC